MPVILTFRTLSQVYLTNEILRNTTYPGQSKTVSNNKIDLILLRTLKQEHHQWMQFSATTQDTL